MKRVRSLKVRENRVAASLRRLEAAKRLTKRRKRLPASAVREYSSKYATVLDALKAFGAQPVVREVSWSTGESLTDPEASTWRKRLVAAVVKALGPKKDDLASARRKAESWAEGQIIGVSADLAEDLTFHQAAISQDANGFIIPLLADYAAGMHGRERFKTEGRPALVDLAKAAKTLKALRNRRASEDGHPGSRGGYKAEAFGTYVAGMKARGVAIEKEGAKSRERRHRRKLREAKTKVPD